MRDDIWTIRESVMPPRGDRALWGRSETLFSLANGHLGLRGDTEEPGPAWQRGTYLNGFHETEPIVYGEAAYGFAVDHQTMLNLPNGRQVRLFVDGEEYRLDAGTCLSWNRELDLRSGVLTRRVEWRLPSGRRVALTSRRLVAFGRPAVAAVSWELSCPDGPAEIRLVVGFDCSTHNLSAAEDPRVGAKFSGRPLEPVSMAVAAEPGRAAATARARLSTRHSRLELACAQRSVLRTAIGFAGPDCRTSGEVLESAYVGRLAAGSTLRLEIYLAYLCPGAGARPDEVPAPGDPSPLLDEAEALGFDGLAAGQRAFLGRFWETADIELDAPEGIQESLRFSLFQLLQSAGRDGRTNLGAKGLSGEGYEGHYFWDTETYVLPLFTYTAPDVARALLGYRAATLGAARRRAAELDHPGALYPWRTIDGREASAYYEAGTAQYHINADIVMALRRYALASGDRAFLTGPAARVSLETARFWLDLGDWVERPDGTTAGELAARLGGPVPTAAAPRRVFCINTVTGPDEYTALVNNNVYTNLMAAMNLEWAADLADWLAAAEPSCAAELAAELRLRPDEPAAWRAAAKAMFVPWDPDRGLFPQDDAFFRKAPWFVNADPPARRPLLLHYHPLVIYRYQVLKQPDLVLAQFLRGELFTAEEKKRHFDYYEPLTTGDSSLSHCIQCVMAARTGDPAKAWAYLTKTVRMDLDDLHGNARDGLHAAAMAGSWLALVYGFAGMAEQVVPDGKDLPARIVPGFDPVLPAELKRLAFRLACGGARVAVSIERAPDGGTVTRYCLLSGASAELKHRSTSLCLDAARPEVVFVDTATMGVR